MPGVLAFEQEPQTIHMADKRPTRAFAWQLVAEGAEVTPHPARDGW